MKKHNISRIFLALTAVFCMVSLQTLSASTRIAGDEVPENGPGMAKVLEQDANNVKTFHVLNYTEGSENPIVRVYNADNKLVLYQSWNGTYSADKFKVVIPSKLPSGTYVAVVTMGKETYRQELNW